MKTNEFFGIEKIEKAITNRKVDTEKKQDKLVEPEK